MSEIPINNNPKPPKRGERVIAKDIADLWQAVKRLAAQQERMRPNVFPDQKLPPLAVTLRRVAGDPVTWEVFTQYGHVVPRHNESAASGAPITIASLPTKDSPLSVVDGSKLWVKVDVDVYGKATGAAWETGASWPTDTPPELIGGDDQTGTVGERFTRIAQIIPNPDSTTDPPQLMVEQLHTGHVDHFQPELVENSNVSPSGGEARVLQVWDASAGKWVLRTLIQGAGITITENATDIEIKADTGYAFPASHPWKCTATGTDEIAVAAGKGLGILSALDFPYILNYASFAGGTIQVTSAIGWIYAVFTCGLPTVYADATLNAGTESMGPTSVVLFFSENDPVGLVPGSSTDEIYVPIAEVALASGVASVTDQILTHNPLLTIERVLALP